MSSPNPMRLQAASWWSKGLFRALILLVAAAGVAAVASNFGIARNYGYLRASILTGTPGGEYHALGRRLAERAARDHGTLTVVPTEGSIENVNRLSSSHRRCTEMFALVQDGLPVSADAGLELLGRLPAPETLLFLGRRNHDLSTFSDIRGLSIGIGPQGSGTAYLLKQLFEDPDLRELDVRLSHHEFDDQAQRVARGELDLAAVVMKDDAEFLHTVIRKYRLDIVGPRDLEGLVARHPWLTLGRIPMGRYDLVHPIPASDKPVARVGTLVLASPCAQRADRIALLMLLGAELPGFVRSNPPSSTGSATAVPLAREAQQFFLTGEPEIADRYFPWLVNLMSPAYWVYLVMAATVLFNALKAYSRFRLWRIDATREKLEQAIKDIVGREAAGSTMREFTSKPPAIATEARASAQTVLNQLAELRDRCHRQASSFVTPMGDEMFYRYQQSLIDGAMSVLAAAIRPSAVKT